MADETKEPRLQVAATAAQAELLANAAERAGYTHSKGGRSAYILNAALSAAAVTMGGASVNAGGDIARAILEDAAADGLTVEAWLDRALMLTRATRMAPAPTPLGRRRKGEPT